MDDPKDTRTRLLEQGLLLARIAGLRGVTVREVARRAEVNLGSFVYHFGTRDQFIAALVEHWYAPMFEALRNTRAAAGGTALATLRGLLHQVLDLAAAHAPFITHLVADALAGEPSARTFLLRLPGRHPALILEQIAQAQADGDLPREEAPLHLAAYLMGAAAAPLVLAQGPLARADWLASVAPLALAILQDPEGAHRRLDWALQGLLPHPCPRRMQ